MYLSLKHVYELIKKRLGERGHTQNEGRPTYHSKSRLPDANPLPPNQSQSHPVCHHGDTAFGSSGAQARGLKIGFSSLSSPHSLNYLFVSWLLWQGLAPHNTCRRPIHMSPQHGGVSNPERYEGRTSRHHQRPDPSKRGPEEGNPETAGPKHSHQQEGPTHPDHRAPQEQPRAPEIGHYISSQGTTRTSSRTLSGTGTLAPARYKTNNFSKHPG